MGCISNLGGAGTRRSAPATAPPKARRTSSAAAKDNPTSSSVEANTTPLSSKRRMRAALVKCASSTMPANRAPTAWATSLAGRAATGFGNGGRMAVLLKSNNEALAHAFGAARSGGAAAAFGDVASARRAR